MMGQFIIDALIAVGVYEQDIYYAMCAHFIEGRTTEEQIEELMLHADHDYYEGREQND